MSTRPFMAAASALRGILLLALATLATAESGLAATYYANPDFTGASVSRIDRGIDFALPGEASSPAPGIGDERWSAIWTGSILAPRAGGWTFTTLSDDGIVVLIDGVELIADWTGHAPTEASASRELSAGWHAIQVRYYNGHLGATARLWWQGPGQERAIVPAWALSPQVPTASVGSGSGLRARYFANPSFTGSTVTRLEPGIDAAWNGEPPAPGIPSRAFSAEWSGWLEPQFTDTYVLSCLSSGGVEVLLDGQPLIAQLGIVALAPPSASVALVAGRRYELRVRLRHVGDRSRLTLRWSCPFTAMQAVPSTQLYPADAVAAGAIALLAPLAESGPILSRTSPAWIEGSVGGGDARLAATLDGEPLPVVRSSLRRWHLAGTPAGAPIGVPLTPEPRALVVTSTAGAGSVAVERSIVWEPTDLARLPKGDQRLAVRAGDSLLLTASGSGRRLELDLGGRERVSGVPGERFPARFDVAGEHQVVARIDGAVVGTLRVAVIAVDLRGPIACQLGYRRLKDVATIGGAPGDVAFVANDAGWLEVGEESRVDGGRSLSLRPLLRGELALQARLGGAEGPLLASCPVDEFTLASSADRSIAVVETYPDGQQLVEATLTLTPPVRGLDIRLSMYTGGAGFDDGSVVMAAASEAFEPAEKGGTATLPYRMLRLPKAWVCHNVHVFQDGVLVSHF